MKSPVVGMLTVVSINSCGINRIITEIESGQDGVLLMKENQVRKPQNEETKSQIDDRKIEFGSGCGLLDGSIDLQSTLQGSDQSQEATHLVQKG